MMEYASRKNTLGMRQIISLSAKMGTIFGQISIAFFRLEIGAPIVERITISKNECAEHLRKSLAVNSFAQTLSGSKSLI